MFVHEDQDVAADGEELSTFPVAGISDTNEKPVFFTKLSTLEIS